VKIRLKKSFPEDESADWYSIIRKEYIPTDWWEQSEPMSSKYCNSERLIPNDACIEGTKEEMIAIAKAIKNKESVSFKRCAVRFDRQGYYFCSPRNSRKEAFISDEDALEFANEVLGE
jgi:hypothetical protein